MIRFWRQTTFSMGSDVVRFGILPQGSGGVVTLVLGAWLVLMRRRGRR